MELLYASLREQAAFVLQSQSSNVTLSPVALVNEVFIRLDKSNFDIPNRYAFKALYGRAMRNVMVSYFRSKSAAKRSGQELTITLAALSDNSSALSTESFIDLSNALEKLKVLDERCYRLCDAHYFAGMTYPELAELEDISEATVTRELRFARAWLKSRLDIDSVHETN